MAADWKTGIIYPFFTKGNSPICCNYKGVTPFDVVYRIFSIILMTRLNLLYHFNDKGKIKRAYGNTNVALDQKEKIKCL